MNQGGWTCPHDVEGICDIIKKECDPGDRGCVLYGKITSSRKSALPTFLGGTGTFFPSAYDLFNVEFIAL